MPTPNTAERKPYLRYRLSADINDRGVAFSVRTATKAFLKAQGFEGTVTDLDSTTSHFTAVLSIYDNGRYDFNAKALHEHIESSGQLPTTENHKPKITIEPIPVDSTIVIKQDDESVKTYEAIVANKNQELAERDKTISGLTQALTERQKALHEKDRRISSLEATLNTQEPTQFDSAREAILGSYLKKGLDVLMNISLDLQDLNQSGDVAYLLEPKRKELTFSGYVSRAFNVQIQNDAELNAIAIEVKKYQKWEETPEARTISATLNKMTVNERLLDDAIKNGAGTEVIEMLKKIVGAEGQQKVAIDYERKTLESAFNAKKAIMEQLPQLKEKYATLRRVIQSCEARSQSGVELPILFQITENPKQEEVSGRQTITLTLPVIGYGGEYEAHLFKIAKDIIEDETRVNDIVQSTSKNENFSFAVFDPEMRGGVTDFFERTNKALKIIAQDELTKALGVKLKITCLTDIVAN